MESPAKGVGATAPSIQEGIPVPWKTMGALVHGRPRHAVVQANLESSSFKGGIVVSYLQLILSLQVQDGKE